MSIFSVSYWKSAAAELKRPRQVVLAALFVALSVALAGFYIPVGENLRVMFQFLATGVGASIYGPVMALLAAAVSDTVGFILFPQGGYFPGYLLSAMLGGLVYALVLYRRTVTVPRLFLAKFLVNYGVNVLLGSVWSAMLYGKGYWYYLFKSLIKNSILLPVEVLLLAMLFAAVLPVLSRLGHAKQHSARQLGALRPEQSAFWIFGADFLVAAAAAVYFGLTTERLLLWIGIGAAVAGVALLCAGTARRRAA